MAQVKVRNAAGCERVADRSRLGLFIQATPRALMGWLWPLAAQTHVHAAPIPPAAERTSYLPRDGCAPTRKTSCS
eukprot:scaffold569_cov408-Prasinococcus_capsulatus_cf.AAC.14